MRIDKLNSLVQQSYSSIYLYILEKSIEMQHLFYGEDSIKLMKENDFECKKSFSVILSSESMNDKGET